MILPGAEFGPDDALIYLPFRSQYAANGVQVTRNLGRAGGSIATATMGNGIPGDATVPTRLVGRRGLTFNGASYVQFDCEAPSSKKWTAVAYCSIAARAATDWLAYSLFGQSSGTVPRSVAFGVRGSVPAVEILQESVAWGTAGPAPTTQPKSYILTVDGANATGFVDAVQASTLTLTGTYANLTKCVLNAQLYNVPILPLRASYYYHFSLWPWCMPATEVALLHRQLMRSINSP